MDKLGIREALGLMFCLGSGLSPKLHFQLLRLLRDAVELKGY